MWQNKTPSFDEIENCLVGDSKVDRKQRHLREDTKRNNLILHRQLLLYTFLIVGLSMLFDLINATSNYNQIDADAKFQDPDIIKFCENYALSDIGGFKVNNLEINRNGIKINNQKYGPIVCLALDNARELIFKSLETDKFNSARGLFFSITPGRKI